MGEDTNRVPYVWTAVDQAVARGNLPAWDTSGYVTPYLLRPKDIPDASTIAPGDPITVERSKSEQKLYNSFFEREGYEWVKIPDGIKGGTIEELCAALVASDPRGRRFPATYYDLNAKDKVWPGGIPIWRLLFDHWKNTRYRFAHMSAKGDFRWHNITPQLATEVGGHKLGHVISLRAPVEDVHAVPIGARSTVTQVKKVDPDLSPPKMKVGINHPWAFNKYGFYMGPHEKWIDRWLLFLERNLKIAKNHWGVDVVRIFVLCNGANYGQAVDTGQWRYDGLGNELESPSRRSWQFTPPARLDQKFLDDFRAMLSIYTSVGMKIIPSLLDFGAFNATQWGGKHDLARDPNKRRIFLDTVVDKYMEASGDYRDQILAWEVMNEPSWTTRSFSKPIANDIPFESWRYLPAQPNLKDDELRAFLGDVLARINAAGFPSTVGHRSYGDVLKYSDVTGTMRQFHYYGWPLVDAGELTQALPIYDGLIVDRIPEYSRTQDAFVGEIGAGDHGQPWSELRGADKWGARARVFERLKLLAKKGYKRVLLWPDLGWQGPSQCVGVPDRNLGACLEAHAEDYLTYSSDAVAGLIDFTCGLFPGGVPR